MSQHLIRDPYSREFAVDSTALPFWEHREGHSVIGPVEQSADGAHTGEDPASVGPADPEPDKTGAPKTSKAASRPASGNKE